MAKKRRQKVTAKAKTRPKGRGKKQLAGLPLEIWPRPRQYMERPDRLRYVRKLLPQDTCVFCNASETKPSFENLVLYAGLDAMVMLNKFPYNTGHLLIVPKRHVADITETTAEEHTSISLLIKTSVKLIRAAYTCDGINIGMNLGATAGAGIPGHLHWHIVPRWSGDTNFFPLIAETKCLPETLQQSFDKLYPLFKELT
jgi:ATP adenylyltransferase